MATDALELLQWAYGTFPRLALVASFQAESSVLIDMASRVTKDVRVLTIDTGRLPEETHEVMDRLRDRYGIAFQVLTPEPEEVRQLVAEHGASPFYRSVDLRWLCCELRKARPLARALLGYDAWITGVRRDQAPTRAQMKAVDIDGGHEGIAKIAPLAEWSGEQVWEYIRSRDVPYNRLYDQGYTSIGCAPCTRATHPGEESRAGRWWWEHDQVKECGLHWMERERSQR